MIARDKAYLIEDLLSVIDRFDLSIESMAVAIRSSRDKVWIQIDVGEDEYSIVYLVNDEGTLIPRT